MTDPSHHGPMPLAYATPRGLDKDRRSEAAARHLRRVGVGLAAAGLASFACLMSRPLRESAGTAIVLVGSSLVGLGSALLIARLATWADRRLL